MKLVRIYSVLVGVLFQSCVHNVHSLNVNDETQSQIKQSIETHCKKDSCSLQKCWEEEPDLYACRVEFSLSSDYERSNILTKIVDDLEEKGIDSGFCASDTVPAGAARFAGQMAGAILAELLVAVVSGGRAGGNNPFIHGGSHENSVAINTKHTDVCDTEPVLQGKQRDQAEF
ncbi:MAG: hypothetical protein NT027_13000 [Proteobacteria bacterium]|nr:hypothetical protein [Pseudomonadota bacterium]